MTITPYCDDQAPAQKHHQCPNHQHHTVSPDFGIKRLSRLHRKGVPLSTHYIAQLGSLQIDAGLAPEAQRTLTAFVPAGQIENETLARKLDLLPEC